jgi:hypothetical protein
LCGYGEIADCLLVPYMFAYIVNCKQ